MDLQTFISQARTVGGVPFAELHLEQTSIGHLLAHRSGEHPSKPYLIYYDDGGERTEYSYQEFRTRVQRVAGYMRSRGIGAGDRIATIAHNHSDTVIQYFAAWWIGATIVPVNVGEDDARITYVLTNSGARLAFVRDDYLNRLQSLMHETPALATVVVAGQAPAGHESFDAILNDASIQAPEPLGDLMNHECMIVYTSGTTGNPKGVLLAQGNLLADCTGIAAWHGVEADSRMMCVLPIHHVNGTVVTLVTPMVAGGSVVLNRKFQSGRFFQRIAAEGVAIVSVVPTLLAFLVQADIDTSALDLARFRHIICGAGPLTCELAQRFEERYRVPIIHGYGLSETTCYSCFLPADLPDEERMRWHTAYGFPSIGVPIPQNEMAIHDANGNALPPGERGEIVIRGHNVMLEYYGNEEANLNAFTFGWFRSGDEGFMTHDDAGRPYFFITGRIKELIIRGGVNISPLEIDEVINSHPKVDAGICVGFENNWYGEEIGAYVRRGDPSLTDQELLAFCREHLPPHKAPKVVVFGDDIPVTSTGKYQRNRVKHLFAEHREKQFR
ncbi:MAG: acyl--CoA ligase [Bacteroidetes bacterium]|nr:acyl--CoA ligase [Bacteroidota bacterium]